MQLEVGRPGDARRSQLDRHRRHQLRRQQVDEEEPAGDLRGEDQPTDQAEPERQPAEALEPEQPTSLGADEAARAGGQVVAGVEPGLLDLAQHPLAGEPAAEADRQHEEDDEDGLGGLRAVQPEPDREHHPDDRGQREEGRVHRVAGFGREAATDGGPPPQRPHYDAGVGQHPRVPPVRGHEQGRPWAPLFRADEACAYQPCP